jgi:hypothetical protein
MPITTGGFDDLVQLSQDTLYYLGADFVAGNSVAGSTISYAFVNTAGSLVLAAAPTGNDTLWLPNTNGTLLVNVNVSAGTTSNNLSAVTFSNGSNVSFGLNGSVITASVASSLTGINISAGTTSNNLSAVTFSNAYNVSFGLNASTVTASANLTGDYYDNLAVIQPGATEMVSFSNFTGSASTLFVAPLHGLGAMFPFDITANTCFFPDLSVSGSTATMSVAFTSKFVFGIYTLNASSLSLLNSGSMSFGFAGAATNNSTGFAGGFRYGTFSSAAWSAAPSFKYGSRYWLGWLWSSSGALNQTGAIVGASLYTSGQRSGLLGASNLTATSNGAAPFYGIFTAQTAAMPVSIGSNQLQKTGSAAAFVPHFIMANNASLTVF